MNEDIEELFADTAFDQGWNGDTQLSILFAYIKNQQNDEAFRDHLAQWVVNQDDNDEPTGT